MKQTLVGRGAQQTIRDSTLATVPNTLSLSQPTNYAPTATSILTLTLGAPAEGVNYEKRTAVRCLIVRDGQICIIHVKKGNYYKLPGGGVEPEDQNDTIACQREALEETGCEVDVRPELIAQVTEYRGTLNQESRAYICGVRKDTGKVELTDLEASEGLVHLWCPVTEALQMMKDVEPSNELGEFIKKRDIFLVEAYLQT